MTSKKPLRDEKANQQPSPPHLDGTMNSTHHVVETVLIAPESLRSESVNPFSLCTALRSTYISQVLHVGQVLHVCMATNANFGFVVESFRNKTCSRGKVGPATIFMMSKSNRKHLRTPRSIHQREVEQGINYINDFFKEVGMPHTSAVLLIEGPRGVGKTTLLHDLADPFFHIYIDTLMHIPYELIQMARCVEPCVIICDNIMQYPVEVHELSKFFEYALRSWRSRRIVLVLSDSSKLSTHFPWITMFKNLTLTVSPPCSIAERRLVLDQVLDFMDCRQELRHLLQEYCGRLRGFTLADMQKLVSCVLTYPLIHGEEENFTHHIQTALKLVKPFIARNFDIITPNVLWSDIGGQEVAKSALQEAVLWITAESSILRSLGVRPPRGILLHGPPGCSKTMLAKALATETSMTFISVKGPELLSMWVGESEKAIQNLFLKARQVAPALIFFDELDGLCGHRSERGGSNDRVISQLLSEMDGIESDREENHILVIGATNRPCAIDRALLRPGRFDRKIYVGLPTQEERAAIFQVALRDIPVDTDVSPVKLSVLTPEFSGAHCVAVCKEAAFRALESDWMCEKLTMSHFNEAVERIAQSIR